MQRFCQFLLMCTATLLSMAGTAQNDCFSNASSYYEHMYCQIKAEGSGKHLPGFRDFSINNELTQALLLKPYARELGIPLTMPKKVSETEKVRIKGASIQWAEAEPSLKLSPPGTVRLSPDKPSRVEALEIEKTQQAEESNIKVARQSQEQVNDSSSTRCQREAQHLLCNGIAYLPLGNMSNESLSASALTEENQMILPEFTGDHATSSDVNQYLRKAYAYYLDKMIEIGLAGKTLTFGKFASLFNELNRKGVDFRDRFSTMYRYLKKDKATMQVDTSVIIPDTLDAEDCSPLNELLVCDHTNGNYLFRRDA